MTLNTQQNDRNKGGIEFDFEVYKDYKLNLEKLRMTVFKLLNMMIMNNADLFWQDLEFL